VTSRNWFVCNGCNSRFPIIHFEHTRTNFPALECAFALDVALWNDNRFGNNANAVRTGPVDNAEDTRLCGRFDVFVAEALFEGADLSQKRGFPGSPTTNHIRLSGGFSDRLEDVSNSLTYSGAYNSTVERCRTSGRTMALALSPRLASKTCLQKIVL
jgi:hypothetical protein